MQDAMLLVYRALKNDQALNAKVNGIYNDQTTPDENVFPRITMFEILNRDSDYADDAPQYSIVDLRIDVWSKTNNLFDIAREVKRVLLSEFPICKVNLKNDLYEKDVQIHHKPIDIKIKIEQ